MRGGRCIAALFRGEDSLEADAGGIIVAEALDIFRQLHTNKGR